MDGRLTLTVVTPERAVVAGVLCDEVTLPGLEGEMGILPAHTPLIALSKAEIVRLGVSLGLDYGLTHSCYDPLPAGGPCGHCDSCRLRAAGFAEAGTPDPIFAR